MIRVILIDDENDARFVLRSLIERHFSDSLRVVAEADDVESGLAAISTHQPDLVFLDIQLRSGTGFDLLQRLPRLDFEVIFVTAYHQYAVDAFRFSAFGYLLKPVRSREFQEVVSKLELRMNQLKSAADKRLKVLIENYGSEGEIHKLIIPNMEGFQVVKVRSIIRLEGDRNYTHFILEQNKKITTSKSLGEYEELLNDYGFFRIHQSTIISLRHVESFQRGDGGTVEMSDGASLKISRYRKAEFLKRFV